MIQQYIVKGEDTDEGCDNQRGELKKYYHNQKILLAGRIDQMVRQTIHKMSKL